MSMAESAASRMTLTLALDPAHWRRHDRAFWARVLAEAVDQAATHLVRVDRYEMEDAVIYVHVRCARPAKQMRKLLEEDELFLRLRSRLVDLGARAEFEIAEDS
jgi:hypothetical protein